MKWFKNHADTISIIAAIATGVFVMVSTMNGIDSRLSDKINGVQHELSHEIAKVRLDLSHEIAKVRGELSKEISNVRNELSHEIAGVNNEIVKIQTILILRGLAPPDLFAHDKEIKD